MIENKINNLLVKLSKKQLQKILDDLPTVPFDMDEDERTRRVPKPNSKTRIVIYIRYHWLDTLLVLSSSSISNGTVGRSSRIF